MDLAIAGDDNAVSVLLNKGDGAFEPAVSYIAVSAPDAIAVADFNGDARADLVTANYGDGLSILLGTSILPASTTTMLLSTPNLSQYGQAVTISAKVSPKRAPGMVDFMDGDRPIGTCILDGIGQCQVTYSLLPSGARLLRAIYRGVRAFGSPVNRLL
jgi:hypothetical protein